MRLNFCFQLALLLVFTISGCNQKSTPRSDTEPGQLSSDKGDTIISGSGTNRFQLGMSIQTATQLKQPTDILTYENSEKWLEYDEDGIGMNCKDGRVVGVHFNFLSKKFRPFRGKTREGIGAKSSFRDVICTYGQPTKLTNTIETEYSEWPGARNIAFYYLEKGISFQFTDGRLSEITVFAPQRDYDIRLWEDIGDTGELRAIECDNDVVADEPPENGPYVTYYENGKKKSEEHYKDGNLDGPVTEWYKNGQKEWEAQYKNDKPDGLWTAWHENGKKKLERHFRDGRLVSASAWKWNGDPCPITKVVDGSGKAASWHENGQKYWGGQYKNGERDGLFTKWYENGQKEWEHHYNNGKWDGLVTSWYTNGQKQSEIQFKDGKLEGLSTWWHENGKKWSEIQYKDGHEVSRKEF